MGILRCVGNAFSFLDVLSAVPPFLSHAWKSKPAERRDRSQSIFMLQICFIKCLISILKSIISISRTVLPQPLVQKSFYNLQNSFFPTKFPCHPNGGKNQENSSNLRQMYHRPYMKSSMITLPEILGKLSRVPSMKVSAPHISLCSSRGVECLIIVEGSDGRRCWTTNFEIYSLQIAGNGILRSSVPLLLGLYYL
jgi:hypothetical protein